MGSANEHQVGGKHYTTGGMQHWDYVQQVLHGEYLMGNVTKYVARHRKKNGMQDLDKAEHYLDKVIELHGEGRLTPPRALGEVALPADINDLLAEFLATNTFNTEERAVMIMACAWRDETDLLDLRTTLLMLQVQYRETEKMRPVEFPPRNHDFPSMFQPSMCLDGPSMRARAVELARKHAARSDKQYAQVADFVPHEWVVQALIEAMEANLNGR